MSGMDGVVVKMIRVDHLKGMNIRRILADVFPPAAHHQWLATGILESDAIAASRCTTTRRFTTGRERFAGNFQPGEIAREIAEGSNR